MSAKAKQWDSISKRWFSPGSERWEVHYTVWPSEAAAEAPDRDPCGDTDSVSRAFPTEGLAVAWARKVSKTPNSLMCGFPRVQRQVFEGDAHGQGCGWWEPAGAWLEVEG